MSWIGVITTAGAALIANCISESKALVIDTVKTGSGTTGTGTEEQIKTAMKAATALNTYVTSGSISGQSSTSDSVTVRMQIGPHTDAYTMKEVGLFGKKDGTDTLVLIALYQEMDGISIPDVDVFPDFRYTLGGKIPISVTDVVVVKDSVAYVPREDFEDLSDDVSELQSDVSELQDETTTKDFASQCSCTIDYTPGNQVISASVMGAYAYGKIVFIEVKCTVTASKSVGNWVLVNVPAKYKPCPTNGILVQESSKKSSNISTETGYNQFKIYMQFSSSSITVGDTFDVQVMYIAAQPSGT